MDATKGNEPKDPFQCCFLSGRVLTPSKRREFSPATKLINYFSGEAGRLENKKCDEGLQPSGVVVPGGWKC